MNTVSLLTGAADYYYTNGYNSYDQTAGTALGVGAIVAIIFFSFLFAAVGYVVMALLLARIFKKAGVEGWKAWVPVYNNWIMLELGGQRGFWAILAFIPIVNIAAVIFTYIAMYHIGLHLGKDGAFVLLAIFLPIVWYIWLAVDSSTWDSTPAVVRQPAEAADDGTAAPQS